MSWQRVGYLFSLTSTKDVYLSKDVDHILTYHRLSLSLAVIALRNIYKIKVASDCGVYEYKKLVPKDT